MIGALATLFFGPAGLAEACGIEWEHDAHDTGASDDHQYEDDAGSGTGDDMDVASEDSDDNSWELPGRDRCCSF